MSEINTVEELQKILLENTDLKNKIAEYDQKLVSIDEMNNTIARLNKEQEDISIKAQENAKKAEELSSTDSVRNSEVKSVMDEEVAKLEALRVEMASEKEAMIAERQRFSLEKDEYDRLLKSIETAKDEMASRQIEIAESKSGRASELSALKEMRQKNEIELLDLQRTRDEVSAKSEENRAILEEINKAREGSEKLMADINEARQKSEDRRIAAQSELSSASYAQEMAKNMMVCFRQALNTYIQIAGQAIQIPEITDENRRFIVKDMLSQMTTPWDLESIGISGEPEWETDVKPEMEELSELRKQYEDKFQKKVFNGWGVEELRSKLK